MKRLASFAATLFLASGLTTAEAADVYFDVNDTAPGSGVASQVYDWTTDGSGLAPAGWNPDPGGVGVSPISTHWVNGDTAHFAAGTDAAGVLYGVNIAAGLTATGVGIEEGILRISTGQVNVGTGTVSVNAGAALQTIASLQFATGLKFALKGTSTADAAEIQGRNGSSAGSLLTAGSGLSTVEIDGFGRISYDDGDGVPDNKVSIMSSQIITGVGGTPTNGGAGTLVKSGPDQVGMAVKDMGGGDANFLHTAFAKLRVEEGGFRLRQATVNGVTNTIDERLFGAVPLANLPDAITLDGGGIGSNTTVTLNAFRGITIGPNGGYFDHGAGAGLNIPGPLSGSGALTIGDPTSTSTGNVTFALNGTPVDAFTGDVIGLRATLAVNRNLSVNGLVDGSTANQPANNATVTIGSGSTLTVGNSGGGGTWSRPIGGAGGFAKIGAGTENLTAVNTYGGDTSVSGGTLSITNAYLADTADVHVDTGGILNLNFAGTDTIDQLLVNGSAVAAGIWGSASSGAPNVSALLSGSGTLTVTTGAVVGLAGDFNSDGKVDAADYVTWRKNEVANASLPNDNSVGNQAARFTLWRANFGKPPGAGSGLGSASVPEPATIGLVLLGLAALGLGRRGR